MATLMDSGMLGLRPFAFAATFGHEVFETKLFRSAALNFRETQEHVAVISYCPTFFEPRPKFWLCLAFLGVVARYRVFGM